MLVSMSVNDSRGFIEDTSGTFWGIYGAAGVLLRCPDPHTNKPLVLLQHRSPSGHCGGTWALPGGARDSHESFVEAGVRELFEEAGVRAEDLHIHEEMCTFTSASGWKYVTLLAETSRKLDINWDAESLSIEWVPEEHISHYPLHPQLAATWGNIALNGYTDHPIAPYRLQYLPEGRYWSVASSHVHAP